MNKKEKNTIELFKQRTPFILKSHPQYLLQKYEKYEMICETLHNNDNVVMKVG